MPAWSGSMLLRIAMDSSMGDDMNNWLDWRRDEMIRAAKRREWERLQDECKRRRIDAAIACMSVIGLVLALGIGIVADADAGEIPAYPSGAAVSQCEALYGWPVETVIIEQKFERPLNTWSPGHRGIDLAAETGTAILAPKAGTVSFAGKVAGKDVVSVRHSNGVVSTFEPASTDFAVGTKVTRGQTIGTVEGESDHCKDQCLHWGLKRGAADYLDPEHVSGNKRIALKPLE
ncbi:M23 family metallopeptidase [Bifidobacterium callitrichidarum]|nr:M23 family metallopeptidase [Bifidobacterium callitrichidarum]